MSKIYSGEVSSSETGFASGEINGDRSASSVGKISSRETHEVEDTSEVTGGGVEDDFSDELDDAYSSYMEDGKIRGFEKRGSDEVRESEEPSEIEEADESFKHELDSKYAEYLSGKYTPQKFSESNEDTDIGSEVNENPDSMDSELDKKYAEYIDEGIKGTENTDGRRGELSDSDRAKLKEETGWSDQIADSIDTAEQAEIYRNADLHEDNINGRECLVKEIDYDYVDEKTGMTNRELMAKGRSPYDAKTGEKIELHHMGQEYDAPFAELTEDSEHGDGNHSILHPKTEGSWRNDEILEAQYNKEKREYWKTRSEV